MQTQLLRGQKFELVQVEGERHQHKFLNSTRSEIVTLDEGKKSNVMVMKNLEGKPLYKVVFEPENFRVLLFNIKNKHVIEGDEQGDKKKDKKDKKKKKEIQKSQLPH